MRRLLVGAWSTVLLASSAACDDRALVDPSPVTARRDPDTNVFVVPSMMGSVLGGRMGRLVVHCDGDFIGAGVQEIYPYSFGPQAPPVPPIESLAVGCHDFGTSRAYIVGDPGGQSEYVTDWGPVTLGGLVTVARNPMGKELVFGFTSFAGGFARADGGGTVALGAGLIGAQFSADGSLFATVSPTQVRLYATANPGTALWSQPPPTSEVFRNEVVVGDFLPVSGMEVAVLTQSRKLVMFNQFLQVLNVPALVGDSLAVESQYLPELDGLLVGVPASDSVTLWVGDASVTTWHGVPDSGFGASMATSLDSTFRHRAIGGPNFQNDTGAVWIQDQARAPVPVGIAMPCVVGNWCALPSARCSYGICLGGVACMTEVSGCPGTATCMSGVCTLPDGGTTGPLTPSDGGGTTGQIDAGLDAGSSSDAGAVDAGLGAPGRDAGSGVDAGADDAGLGDGEDAGGELAGPVVFVATCSSAPTTGWLGLALVLLTRRRTRQ